jgi:hypothetical protein
MRPSAWRRCLTSGAIQHEEVDRHRLAGDQHSLGHRMNVGIEGLDAGELGEAGRPFRLDSDPDAVTLLTVPRAAWLGYRPDHPGTHERAGIGHRVYDGHDKPPRPGGGNQFWCTSVARYRKRVAVDPGQGVNPSGVDGNIRLCRHTRRLAALGLG